MYRCSKATKKLLFLVPLWPRLKIKLFKDTQDGALLADVDAAFTRAQWQRQLLAVHMVARRNEKARTWGTGCACHGGQLQQGKFVPCYAKGRRLREIEKYIQNYSENTEQAKLIK